MVGASYQFSDVVEPGKRYYYWLELVTSHGLSCSTRWWWIQIT